MNWAVAMNFSLRNVFWVFGLVLAWRVAMLVFTAQPIPANDAFSYDGAVIHWLLGGQYCNPVLALVFPISGSQVFSAYPPGYQLLLLAWMSLFGTSVIAAMTLHLLLFAAAGFLVLKITKTFFPVATNYGIAVLLFFGITFGDRPDGLAHVLGLGALLLLMRGVAGDGGCWKGAGSALLLFAALYTSPICGALYFGIGFLMLLAHWFACRRFLMFIPILASAALFAGVTVAIAWMKPLWWAGFMESAAQQPSVTNGFHLPGPMEFLKLVRTAPIFVLALFFVPMALGRWKRLAAEPWMLLLAGVFAGGWMLIVANVTLLSPHYIGYVMFSQILLGAGLLAMIDRVRPDGARMVRVLMLCCVALVSIRAVGMTTWGVACARDNSRGRTHALLRTELEPFTRTNTPILLSSAFLYAAMQNGVKHPIHSDWYFNHATWTNNAEINGLTRLRPAKVVLTQFDYYRGFAPVVEQLRRHPDLVDVRVRDMAVVRPPDAIPSLQRVVQHISWAPVIVDLHWKKPAE